jgi:hypothetical protein
MSGEPTTPAEAESFFERVEVVPERVPEIAPSPAEPVTPLGIPGTAEDLDHLGNG